MIHMQTYNYSSMVMMCYKFRKYFNIVALVIGDRDLGMCQPEEMVHVVSATCITTLFMVYSVTYYLDIQSYNCLLWHFNSHTILAVGFNWELSHLYIPSFKIGVDMQSYKSQSDDFLIL